MGVDGTKPIWGEAVWGDGGREGGAGGGAGRGCGGGLKKQSKFGVKGFGAMGLERGDRLPGLGVRLPGRGRGGACGFCGASGGRWGWGGGDGLRGWGVRLRGRGRVRP